LLIKMSKKQGKKGKKTVSPAHGRQDDKGDLDAGITSPAPSGVSPLDKVVTAIRTSRYLQILIGADVCRVYTQVL